MSDDIRHLPMFVNNTIQQISQEMDWLTQVQYIYFGGNYSTNQRPCGGYCACCGEFNDWAKMDDKEKGVCRTCVLVSDVIIRSKQAREKEIDEIARTATKEYLEYNWTNPPFGGPYPWEK